MTRRVSRSCLRRRSSALRRTAEAARADGQRSDECADPRSSRPPAPRSCPTSRCVPDALLRDAHARPRSRSASRPGSGRASTSRSAEPPCARESPTRCDASVSSELAGDEVGDLLADVDRVVADPLDAARDDEHAQTVLALRLRVAEGEHVVDRAAVGAVDQVVQIGEDWAVSRSRRENASSATRIICSARWPMSSIESRMRSSLTSRPPSRLGQPRSSAWSRSARCRLTRRIASTSRRSIATGVWRASSDWTPRSIAT